MAYFKEFRYGNGILYGALSANLTFYADPLIDAGGAVHGGLRIVWDIKALHELSGMMIVSRPMRPATIPEEGEVIFQEFGEYSKHQGKTSVYRDWLLSPAGEIEYAGFSGNWTFLSLFTLSQSGNWVWQAFALALPVSDWDFGPTLASLLPGIALSDDMNAVSPAEEGNLLVEILDEFGFLLDEVKTMAEALVPFWDVKNIPPQAVRAVARLMHLEYLSSLGTGVYQDLLGMPHYRDNSLDALGRKAEIVLRWNVRPRLSTNLMLDLNDSSAESTTGQWRDTAGNKPTRAVHTVPPAILGQYDLANDGFFRFTDGTWWCGRHEGYGKNEHYLLTDDWPAAFGGFIAKKNGAAPVTVKLALMTYASDADDTGTEVTLHQADLTEQWAWYSSPNPVPMNTDTQAVVVLKVSPTSAAADIDTICVGPVSTQTTHKTPVLSLTLVDAMVVRLSVADGPEWGTASINWGDGSPTTEVEWSALAKGQPIDHDYRDVRTTVDARKYFVSVKDVKDPLVYCSGTVMTLGDI